MKISAVIMAYNEEENLPVLSASIKGVEDVVLVDHDSTDKTAEIGRSIGMRVVTMNNLTDIPTRHDRELFIRTFGYLPVFTEEHRFFNGGKDHNFGASLTKNDWCFYPDCDETVEWDLPEIEKLADEYDKIDYVFYHTKDFTLVNSKLAKRSVYKWSGRIHEVLTGNGRTIFTDKMKLIHHQKPKAYRSDILPKLEYAVLKDGDPRSKFYLARTYWESGRYEDALRMFDLYMKVAWYRPEIAEAWLCMAKCCWQIQRGDDARKYCLNAIAVNPDFAEALYWMSVYTEEGQKQHWLRYAKIAGSTNTLFQNHIDMGSK